MFSPNSTAGLLSPRYVVLHYTAGPSYESAEGWLMSVKARASAHYLIGRDGKTGVLVPIDRVAWHAGVSSYEGLTGLNRYSIGIELVALGPLVPDGTGFKSPVYGTKVAPEEVYTGPHPDVVGGYTHWHNYTVPQLAALEGVLTHLFATVPSLKQVIGHRDVARGRKLDPFPLDVGAINARFGTGRTG